MVDFEVYLNNHLISIRSNCWLIDVYWYTTKEWHIMVANHVHWLANWMYWYNKIMQYLIKYCITLLQTNAIKSYK